MQKILHVRSAFDSDSAVIYVSAHRIREIQAVEILEYKTSHNKAYGDEYYEISVFEHVLVRS